MEKGRKRMGPLMDLLSVLLPLVASIESTTDVKVMQKIATEAKYSLSIGEEKKDE